jgi:ComF family protein
MHNNTTESFEIFAPLQYRNQKIKNLLQSLKKRKNLDLGEVLGKYLYESSQEYISELESSCSLSNSIVMPIPLSKTRRAERGYNQSELIALAFSDSWNSNRPAIDRVLYMPDILEKTTGTKKQSTLKFREARFFNIKNSFFIDPKNIPKITDKSIIVIDDITTTGATLLEARDILLKSGARKVILMAIAH